ncbi:type II toxin-antitoxin system RelE/ParE family toxin [Salmonella enterica subsp. enterica serovar Bredeney]|nr:type II toxin-antitoxin system RelE/ParE family toxin [Salmonella enterica subsp. enterica serovar Bredeney]
MSSPELLCGNPDMYKPGRVKGTREVVVRPHYILVYQTTEEGVLTVLHVLRATRQWPPAR